MIIDKFRLNGRTAIVTGSNRGIGQYYALALAEAGADIIGVSYESDFKETEKMITSIGRKFKAYTCDFSDRKNLYQFIENVKSDFKQIDILVNNAGITRDGLILRMKDEDWDDVLAVNLTAAFHITRAVLRGMMKQRYGRIVGISSVVGVRSSLERRSAWALPIR